MVGRNKQTINLVNFYFYLMKRRMQPQQAWIAQQLPKQRKSFYFGDQEKSVNLVNSPMKKCPKNKISYFTMNETLASSPNRFNRTFESIRQTSYMASPKKNQCEQRTNDLANCARIRNQRRKTDLKDRLLERIAAEEYMDDSSDIMSELGNNSLEKQYKLDNFIKRQDFRAKEVKLLKQMREFCRYGCIKQNNI